MLWREKTDLKNEGPIAPRHYGTRTVNRRRPTDPADELHWPNLHSIGVRQLPSMIIEDDQFHDKKKNKKIIRLTMVTPGDSLKLEILYQGDNRSTNDNVSFATCRGSNVGDAAAVAAAVASVAGRILGFSLRGRTNERIA
ncbi:hypothetical protein M0802_001571 [Mischocyttarus mexicanus]|nr:hypothetical protein M0802_001571 [Mischocyttarus mexicanus]